MRRLFQQCEISKREVTLVGIVAVFLFISIMLISRELYDGYHFIDDHEVLAVAQYAKHHTIMDTLEWFVMKDFCIRFRPLYNIELVIQTYLWGVDMNHWIMLVMCEGILSFILFYYFARQLQLSPVLAFLFSGLIHFGGQFTPWYRALNQENLAMVLTGGALCCLPSKRRWALCCATVFAMLAAMQKESFSLLLPVYPLLHFFIERQKGSILSLKSYIRRHIYFIIILTCMFLIEESCIVFFVGTNQIGYAGLGGGTPLYVYIETLIESMSSLLYLAPLTVYSSWNLWKYYRADNFSKCYKLLIVFGGYVVLSQLALHAKSGIEERYLVPFMLGWALLIVYLPAKVISQSNAKKIFTILCVLSLLVGIGKSYRIAERWANVGTAQRMLLSTIEKRMVHLQQSPLLLYTDGYELDVGARDWLKYFVQPDLNVIIYGHDKITPNPNAEYPVIVLSSENYKDKGFFEAYQIDKDSYISESVGNKRTSYVVLYREKPDIQSP